MVFDQAYGTASPPIDRQPTDTTPYTGAYPFKQVLWWPMSECFPTNFLPDEDGSVSNELAGVLANISPGQVIAGGVDLNFVAPIREIGGTWWDPGGNANEIVVPAPFNWVNVMAAVNTGAAVVNSISLAVKVNGSFLPPVRIVNTQRQSGSSQATDVQVQSPHWIPVSTGDIIQVWASQSGGTVSGSLGNSWVSVRGAFFV